MKTITAQLVLCREDDNNYFLHPMEHFDVSKRALCVSFVSRIWPLPQLPDTIWARASVAPPKIATDTIRVTPWDERGNWARGVVVNWVNDRETRIVYRGAGDFLNQHFSGQRVVYVKFYLEKPFSENS